MNTDVEVLFFQEARSILRALFVRGVIAGISGGPAQDEAVDAALVHFAGVMQADRKRIASEALKAGRAIGEWANVEVHVPECPMRRPTRETIREARAACRCAPPDEATVIARLVGGVEEKGSGCLSA